jgi:DNA invertase Pin-like site-specific DNA recombinase
LRAALYIRVSKSNQEAENQLIALRQFAGSSGAPVVKEYIDEETGISATRPGFLEMLEDARLGKFDLLIFWALDRLTREGALETLQYLERLTGYGCKWRSYQELYIDSLGPFADAVISIIATIASMERQRISERTKAGLVRAKANGSILGRPNKILDREAMQTMLDDGHSLRRVAREFSVSPSTVRKRISR